MHSAQALRARLKKAHEKHTSPAPAIESSVLVLLSTSDSGQEEILLTKRTNHVDTHKGQISFPGGLRDKTDADLLQTALRESFEEIGANSEFIEILGALPRVITRGNVLIFPWVGYLAKRPSFLLNEKEVEKIIYLPMARLLQDGLQEVQVAIEGISLKSIGITVEKEMVWGATARILQDLRHLLLEQNP